jgi:hypothetical protein
MSDFSDTLKLFTTFIQPLFATLEMFEKMYLAHINSCIYRENINKNVIPTKISSYQIS